MALEIRENDEFDLAGRSQAETFHERTLWDGANHLSVHTFNSQDHQTLCHTPGGVWVLHRWSERQDTQQSYQFVPGDRARQWLALNHNDAAVQRYFGGADGGGRSQPSGDQ